MCVLRMRDPPGVWDAAHRSRPRASPRASAQLGLIALTNSNNSMLASRSPCNEFFGVGNSC